MNHQQQNVAAGETQVQGQEGRDSDQENRGQEADFLTDWWELGAGAGQQPREIATQKSGTPVVRFPMESSF